MQIPFLDLSKSDESLNAGLREAAARVIASGRYLHGEETRKLEEKMKEVCGADYCVGVSNGLDALRLIIKGYISLGRLRPGDEILYPGNTYIASVMPLVEFGLKPVGIDPDPLTHNIDLRKALEEGGDRVKGIMLVHLYGTPAWDAGAAAEMRERGWIVIEDNAQAIGAKAASPGFNGHRYTGGLGDAAGISFYPTKNIGALGDAGCVVTSDRALADTVRTLANYGSDRRYHNILDGYNCRIDEIQAAFLNVKLERLDEVTASHRRVADIYNNCVRNAKVTLPAMMPDAVQVWHQYVVRVRERDMFREWLNEKGIATDIHYPVPPHLQPCLEGKTAGRMPVSEMLAGEVVSLPIAGLRDEEAGYVADVINKF